MAQLSPFKFNHKKTIQAVALLLKQEDRRSENYMRIIKLLYIADRESLAETGRPITGDRFVAMERGPVLSHLLDLIHENSPWAPEWQKFILTRGYHILLENDPGNGDLCRYEISKLKEVWERYHALDEWEMVRITHEFPEWKRNDPGNSSKPIPLEDVLDAIAVRDRQDEVLEQARESKAMTHLFGE